METYHTLIKRVLQAGIFVTPFIALIVSESLFFPFITGKNFTFRILVEILFATWIIGVFLDYRFRPRFSWLLVAFGGFLAVIGIADLMAEDSFRAFWSNFERMEGYVTLVHLAMYFLVLVSVFKTKKAWEWLFHTWIGVGGFLGLYGIVQVSSDLDVQQSPDRIDATLGNATYLAAVAIFFLFFVFYYGFKNKEYIKTALSSVAISTGLFVASVFKGFMSRSSEARMIYGDSVPPDKIPGFFMEGTQTIIFVVSLVAFGLAIFALFKQKDLKEKTKKIIARSTYLIYGLLFVWVILNTQTRGAILGVLLGVGVLALLSAILSRNKPMVRKVAVGVTLVGIVVGILLASVVTTNTRGTTESTPIIGPVAEVMNEVPGLRRVAGISLGEKTVRSRFMIWEMSYEGFKEKPLFGWGQGNFGYVFAPNYNPRMFDQEPWFDRTHNIVFDWLIAGGILGLAGYLSLWVIALWILWRAESEKFSNLEKSMLSGLLVAFFFHNLFVFDQIVSYLLFFAVIAFIYSITRTDKHQILGGKGSMPIDQVGVFVTPIVVIVLVFSVYVVNIRPISAGSALIDGITNSARGNFTSSLVSFKKALSYDTIGKLETVNQLGDVTRRAYGSDSTAQQVKREFFDTTIKGFDEQIKKTPKDAMARIQYGGFLRSFGRLDQAIEQYEVAKKYSPNKQDIRFLLGDAYLAKEEYQKAFEEFRHAYKVEPSYTDAVNFYAVGAIYVGNQEALNEARGALSDEEFYFEDRIARAYLQNERFEELAEMYRERINLLLDSDSLLKQYGQEKTLKMYTNLMAVLLELGRIQDAIEVIDEAVEFSPDFEKEAEELKGQIRAGDYRVSV